MAIFISPISGLNRWVLHPEFAYRLICCLATAFVLGVLGAMTMFCYASLMDEVSGYRKVFNNGYTQSRDFYEQNEFGLAGIIKAAEFSRVTEPHIEREGGKVFSFESEHALGGMVGILNLSEQLQQDMQQSGSDLIYLDIRTGIARYVLKSSSDNDEYLHRLREKAKQLHSSSGAGPEAILLMAGHGDQKRVYLFEQIAPRIMPDAWLGISLPQKQIVASITSQIEAVPELGIKYLVLDQHGQVVRGKAEKRWSTQTDTLFLKKLVKADEGFSVYSMPVFKIALKKEIGGKQRWIVYYASFVDILWQIRYALLFGLGLCAIAAVLAYIAVRHLRHAVFLPAKEREAHLLEREAFNRAMLELAPVGICVFRRADGELLIRNERARLLLELGLCVGGHRRGLDAYFLNVPVPENGIPFRGDVTVEAIVDATPHHIHFALAELQYNDQPVLFCVFSDDSDRKNAELALASAKSAADAANKAKSAF
ncbi:hypothetical protein, partial [Jeongeupia chitinilytica]|uniref:hypothetical protein n=1 Tax=Jeongeupia chitinilytica TaxID=1041641 RepID=UPI001675D90B